MISGSRPLLIPKMLMKNVIVSMNAPDIDIVKMEMKKKESIVIPLMKPNKEANMNPKTAIKILLMNNNVRILDTNSLKACVLFRIFG